MGFKHFNIERSMDLLTHNRTQQEKTSICRMLIKQVAEYDSRSGVHLDIFAIQKHRIEQLFFDRNAVKHANQQKCTISQKDTICRHK